MSETLQSRMRFAISVFEDAIGRKADESEIASITAKAQASFGRWVPVAGRAYVITDCACVGSKHGWSQRDHKGMLLLAGLVPAGAHDQRYHESCFVYCPSVMQADGVTKNHLMERVSYTKFSGMHTMKDVGSWIDTPIAELLKVAAEASTKTDNHDNPEKKKKNK